MLNILISIILAIPFTVRAETEFWETSPYPFDQYTPVLITTSFLPVWNGPIQQTSPLENYSFTGDLRLSEVCGTFAATAHKELKLNFAGLIAESANTVVYYPTPTIRDYTLYIDDQRYQLGDRITINAGGHTFRMCMTVGAGIPDRNLENNLRYHYRFTGSDNIDVGFYVSYSLPYMPKLNTVTPSIVNLTTSDGTWETVVSYSTTNLPGSLDIHSDRGPISVNGSNPALTNRVKLPNPDTASIITTEFKLAGTVVKPGVTSYNVRFIRTFL
ncbi:hypothetical protein EYZ49_12650 [Salmonella enterica subsp. salamae serovar 13,22:z:-]|uniref:hypothetical protein n=1 Tax=Salmonella enterica TaxID=28901 RepID=UPI001033DA81|nr:hypothetical protein [Salmonella enterica]TBN98607.1 hypothetical protein EYZ49_12650 [Salmonella enterica subsp. salamae serovar 13,22:z:-]